MRHFFVLLPLLIVLQTEAFSKKLPTKVSGYVFEDINQNGVLDKGEPLVEGVAVSNGLEVVLTNEKGFYELPLQPKQTIFVSKPSGYELRKNSYNTMADFLHFYPEPTSESYAPTVAQNAEVPTQLNFPLRKIEEPKTFTMAMLGDIQARYQHQVNYAHEVAEELYQYPNLKGAVMLGDMGDDNAMIFPALNELFKQFTTTVYPVAGNHDRNYDIEDLTEDFSGFKKYYGPDQYSFNIGDVHFIAINNVTTIKGIQYKDFIPKNRMEWIKNDLATVPKEKLIVFLQHIPLGHMMQESRDELMEVIKDFPNVKSFSGHLHSMTHLYLPYGEDKVVHDVVTGAACGLWWGGELDLDGIPHGLMGCGSPKGYYIAHFNGTEVNMEYKASGKPKEKQMRIWVHQPANEKNDPTIHIPEGLTENHFLANIWAGSIKTEAYAQIDGGEWQKLERRDKIVDPTARRIFLRDSLKISNHKSHIGPGYPKNIPSHIWVGEFPEGFKDGSHIIKIKAVDPSGMTFEGHRIFTKGNFDGDYEEVDWYNMN
ncbi:calcineurin-like phosphoesterase family protein [Flammeovirga sp. EKP202]|uniref:calcineurin-like phosphoesterase family protein n=1 Tax=Flammeovirga sp. EKP202 TaxID=2770592 RepID=UPI00165EEBEC|nr:calcineurin-like phosphoesterase family protein [Flammeovirga sp. EKP202]MBD0401750.1 calcineurin-like phosphoesterase family protein [Flammeovirga sp. EKP202]